MVCKACEIGSSITNTTNSTALWPMSNNSRAVNFTVRIINRVRNKVGQTEMAL